MATDKTLIYHIHSREIHNDKNHCELGLCLADLTSRTRGVISDHPAVDPVSAPGS